MPDTKSVSQETISTSENASVTLQASASFPADPDVMSVSSAMVEQLSRSNHRHKSAIRRTERRDPLTLLGYASTGYVKDRETRQLGERS